MEVASVEAAATTCGGLEEVSTGSVAHFLFPAEGRSGWAYAGAAVGDAYVRVVRAKAVRAPPVTAGGDISAQCATRLAPLLPSPSRGGYRPGPLPLPTCSGDPLSPASPDGGPSSISPARAQPGLVYPAPLAAASGFSLALGPILQMEKLTHGAPKCFALGP